MAAAPPTASAAGATAATRSSGSTMEPSVSSRTALVIDGAYALIGARNLGGKIDYVKLRAVLEEQASTQFGDCWYFDQNPDAQLNAALTTEYQALKFARPDGPQFQVSVFPMKKYKCHCRKCGNHFMQNVQKGVDNGIATKILSLAYENICDRFILFAGDGDFYSSLSLARNVLRKDIWVIGYRGTVSGDLQQLASRVIWMNDLWREVKGVAQNSWDRQRNGDRNRTQGIEHALPPNGSVFPVDDSQQVSDRQVVIAPLASESADRSNRSSWGKARGRGGRSSSRGRKGRGRSRSRSRDRPRVERTSHDSVLPADASTGMDAAAATGSASSAADGSRGAGGRGGKKRKRNGIAENHGRRSANRGARGGQQALRDAPMFAFSDVSESDEELGKPFPLSLPVPLRPAVAVPMTTVAVGRKASLSQVINLASDTDSE